MARLTYPIAEVLEGLNAAPARIAELTEGVPAAKLKAAPEPGEWSVVEILAHMRACGDVWGGHIAAILAQDNPTRRGVSPRQWIRDKDYASLPFSTSLHAYAAQRAGLLELLRPLPEKDWARAATIVGAGTPLSTDVRFYASKLFEHERPHLDQIAKTVAVVR
jgi:DinB superfamily